MEDKGQIPEFYAHRSVLITGATGFLGKVLIWKLLQSCPLVENIYILIRSKRDIDVSNRRIELLECPIFDNFRQNDIGIMDKVIAISGDVALPNLGISEKDRTRLLNDVSIVMHGAALLKMDASLKEAINVNAEGVLRMLDLAQQMKRLEAFVYISTAYCCCNEELVKEQLYPMKTNPYAIIDLVHNLPSKILDKITNDLIEPLPNTYTFSKRITELLLMKFESKLPIIITRPTIVISSMKEPFMGWIDNINGCIGIAVAVGKGVLRSMLADPNKNADLMPVDIVCNALIAIPWAEVQKNSFDKIPVYNIAVAEIKHINWRDYQKTCTKAALKYPFDMLFWYPTFDMIEENKYRHKLKVIFYQLLPALIIDFILLLLGRKRFMMRVQQKILHGLKVLTHFSCQQWTFETNNLLKLKQSMNAADRKNFPVTLQNMVDFEAMAESAALTVKKYILKEDMNNLEKCRLKLKLLYYLKIFVNVVFVLIFVRLLFSILISYFR